MTTSSFYYNDTGPILAPYPTHLKRSMSKGGRFVSYVEDGRLSWAMSFDDQNAALDSMRWIVSRRLTLSGAGCGAVLDDEKGIIIAVDEMLMPLPVDMSEVVESIRARCSQGQQ